MCEEDKILVLKDLSARQPYGVKCEILGRARRLLGIDFNNTYPIMFDYYCDMPQRYMIEDIKPYLRSMSSMTEEEIDEYCDLIIPVDGGKAVVEEEKISSIVNFYHKHHIDYRGLIPKGLAIEVTKENNPYKD